MEYKKVDKCTRRADTRQRNNLLKERSEKCHFSKTSESKPSIIKWTNPVNNEDCKEIINEEINPNGNHSSKRDSPIDIIKEANFEYEEEWDIGGISEILSELDADIEKSLNKIQTSKFDSIKNAINNKKDNFKPTQSEHSEKVLNYLNTYENKTSLKISKHKSANESNTPKSASLTTVCYSSSKFTGFSKGGHLISSSSNLFSLCSTKLNVNSGELYKSNCLDKEDFKISMSSQVGNNGNTSSNISGIGINTSSGQSTSGSNISSKPNNKMSIDHQATLDKGLKMKIKRTKPGTKSSEAKHEIVKATEQQQNGLIGSGTSQEDINCLLTNQSTSSCSQNSNVALGISNAQGNTNSLGSKKSLGSGNNQNNASMSCGNISLSNSVSGNNNVSQTLSQGTKRGSSGHRRDKTKEKSSHSNRIVVEKNSPLSNDKESVERNLCHCTATDSNVSTCSHSSCIRKTENNTLTQRLTSKNGCSNNSNVPPGVFTPSADNSPSVAVSNILAVTTATSTPICTQTISKSVNTNTPGPPSKEVSANSGGSVKISSHIAAQLAAAAASTNPNSGPCIIGSTFPKNEVKSSSTNVQNQISKQVSPSQGSTAVNHTLSAPVSNQKNSLVASVVSDKSVINEHSESPPAKRVKHTDIKTMTSPMKKEMVDICIGTSIGTITEPDCLGPCEPGTSVTLEGIVWHETEGGVLVVNVTWRGKTYVGTLLDCTRHDWAPPRFCDSPTEDLDARTPKGRGKRGRTAITPDLSNFTETRSSIYFSHSHVHSKLRNGSTKGGRAAARTTSVPPADKPYSGSSLSSGNSGSTPCTSPTSFLPPRAEKRKSKDESPPPMNADNDVVNSTTVNASGIPSAVGGLINQPQSLISPVTGLNVQISTKKFKTSTPCAISPVLMECPEQDCSKKFKHVNGLRYHQSHAHGSTSLLDEDSMAETEKHITPQHSPLLSTPTHSLTPNPSNLLIHSQIELTLQPAAVNVPEEYNAKTVSDKNISQQFQNSEKACTLETIPSLSCADIITSSKCNTAVTTVPYLSEGISGETLQHEQQKQFPDIVENNKININAILCLESTNQAFQQSSTGKSGVLRFGQVESKKSGSCLLPAHPPNENMPPSESCESLNNSLISHKKGVLGQQDLNHEIHCEESLEKLTHLEQNEQCKVTNKSSPLASVVAKSKKGRKSPCINDYEAVGVNTCNLSSREDVKSPAYSDISDDSTPVNESDHITKVDIIKTPDIIKKPQDAGLSSSSTCASSQNSISSTLSSYGVYQFYQQQQFIVPTADQQQPSKNTLNSNIGSAIISPPLTQQQTVSEFFSKKEPPLDLITKANLNQPHTSQHCQETKDSSRSICVAGNQGNSELSNVPPVGPVALNAATSSKSVSHFYAFNYMPSNYSFNVEHNFGSSEEIAKHNRILETTSSSELPQQQQQNPVLFKDDRSKEDINSSDTVKSCNLQITSKQLMKSDATVKSESIKQESSISPLSQIPQHMQMPNKDPQGIGVYTNMYQRHPLTLTSQQLSREEELRRYYIFSDQQRRQNNSSQNVVNQQVQNTSSLSGNQQCKDDAAHNQQQTSHNQQPIKIKTTTALNIGKSSNTVTTSKESPKHKQEEESKGIKQEGQKPTMETQGPPPPPTSQYFLHPSYITSTPFGFDPSHPMYRNVLMPASSPYNTPPYHLTMPRYHAPEDLSRNTGTKALDALHHAATQYYTTHKIHELSERARKSPNNSNSNNVPGTNKISVSNTNIGTTHHSNISSNIIGHHTVQNQASSVTQLPHSLASQSIVLPNKQDIAGQKTQGNSPSIAGTPSIEQQKSQIAVNSTVASNCTSGNGSSSSNNINVGSTSDSRSPPPQRHVHTHHHTHVGLGYPMYPAPYGAAVLASQQAAAVAVINPFSPGPNK